MNLASHLVDLDLDLSNISDRHNQYLETWSPFQGGNMLGEETCDISLSATLGCWSGGNVRFLGEVTREIVQTSFYIYSAFLFDKNKGHRLLCR